MFYQGCLFIYRSNRFVGGKEEFGFSWKKKERTVLVLWGFSSSPGNLWSPMPSEFIFNFAICRFLYVDI